MDWITRGISILSIKPRIRHLTLDYFFLFFIFINIISFLIIILVHFNAGRRRIFELIFYCKYMIILDIVSSSWVWYFHDLNQNDLFGFVFSSFNFIVKVFIIIIFNRMVMQLFQNDILYIHVYIQLKIFVTGTLTIFYPVDDELAVFQYIIE